MPRVSEVSLSVPTVEYLLITVGTTRFDNLIKTINDNPGVLIKLCYTMGIREIFLQIGASAIEPTELEIACNEYKIMSSEGEGDANQDERTGVAQTKGGKKVPYQIAVNWVNYSQGFQAFLQNASLVISHAGAGTILERLRSTSAPQSVGNNNHSTNVPKLFVVINELLMDNHQEELAQAFADDNYLFYSKCSDFISVLSAAKWSDLRLYPPPNTQAIIGLVAQSINYSLNSGAVVPIVKEWGHCSSFWGRGGSRFLRYPKHPPICLYRLISYHLMSNCSQIPASEPWNLLKKWLIFCVLLVKCSES